MNPATITAPPQTKPIVFNVFASLGPRNFSAGATADIPAAEADRFVDEGFAHFTNAQDAGDRKRIRMITSIGEGARAFNAGRMYDVDAQTAERLIDGGLAGYVYEVDTKARYEQLAAAQREMDQAKASDQAKLADAIASLTPEVEAELRLEDAEKHCARVRERAMQKAIARGLVRA